MSVELEVDDSLYLEHSSENEYVWGRTSDITKILDETPVRITSSRATQKLPEIESNAKFPHTQVLRI